MLLRKCRAYKSVIEIIPVAKCRGGAQEVRNCLLPGHPGLSRKKMTTDVGRSVEVYTEGEAED